MRAKDGESYQYHGNDGFLWQGSVASVVDLLWPEILGGVLMDKESANEFRLALNRYLNHCGALICQRRGRKGAMPQWWVNERWHPVTIRMAPNEDARPAPLPKKAAEPPTTGTVDTSVDVGKILFQIGAARTFLDSLERAVRDHADLTEKVKVELRHRQEIADLKLRLHHTEAELEALKRRGNR